jgi:hypothetical protein
MVTDRRALAFAVIASLPLVACDTPPPGVTNVAAWHQALTDCRRYARLSGTGSGQWRDYDDTAQPESQYINPCMQARGYPPPLP